MYLNLVQIAESFGVSESVVEDWIRSEGLPHVPERGRLLFDRSQVANWAAARGLTAQAGFLSAGDPALATSWRLEPMLRQAGIWRNVGSRDLGATLIRIVDHMPAANTAVRQLVAQRIGAAGGLNLAPVGSGFALPHPSARIALGRESGTVALIFLAEPLVVADPPDDVPITRLFFFIAPTPRAHLDLLGRLSRLLTRGEGRQRITPDASDADIFAVVAEADATDISPRRDRTP